ncbi:DUF2069 domain-containing protein [Pusillimonas sp. CC-YST705]|uniref:DUF2069 domain-containing protein n=1 Tax=Mesopusillimonas faecipullorum TaxID=2755040 RepID=A0ABS8CBK1_9BURK|nr:DUF2069 domain-containing protein [Mesopusillimonas faecipullorum]MCB5362994.1 DUF2069 domain-containing protein [Mesopusillimonas faecipullorum]
MNSLRLSSSLRWGAAASLILLIVLCLVWELWLAPLRPGGSWLVLKVLPLLLPLRGVLKGSLYTMQWASMLILLYLMEGVVRAYSDPSALSAALGGVEVVLALVFYLCAIFYVRPAKRAARQRIKAGSSA